MTVPIRATRRAVLAGSAAAVTLARAGSALAGPAAASSPPGGPRQRLSLDRGWRFHQGDIAVPPIRDHEAAYAHAKAGNAEGAAASDYDDAAWASVTLPHDWALSQPFDPAANPDQGFRARGIGWYRRYFTLDPADRDRALVLLFDGVATDATVWINGTLAHRQFGGDTGFAIDLSPFALFGDDLNTLAVRVDADASEGWWYEGAGLYRHVWLEKRARVHVATDGIGVDLRRDLAGDWRVPVTLDLVNRGDAARLMVETRLFDPDERPVARAEQRVQVPENGNGSAAVSLAVADPLLWSPDTPTLYRLEVSLRLDGVTVDMVDRRIGFRTIRFDPADGFFLNDRPLKLKGVCAHQDHAGVGVAVPDSLWDYRLLRLKAMGANALRTAHNPPAPALLDAADRLGLLVMDEHRLFSAADEVLDRLAALVKRDSHHPSVILWSLCNEESLQASGIGVAMIRRMKAVVRALDPGRPVTAALNGAMFASPNIADELDVVGFNYGQQHYDRYHAAFPDRPLLSSEDTSAYMTRGALATDRAAHVLADDDSEHAGWGETHRASWAAIAARPFLAGGFVWTGFDYRGEPTPFGWPSVGAQFGAMDLCGFAKSAFYIRQAQWLDAPMLRLWPHWNHHVPDGAPVTLLAITSGDRVVLRLNGAVVADQPVEQGMARLALPYRPGRVEAIAFRGGRPIAQDRIETSTAPARIELIADRATLQGDGRDTVPVTVRVLDAQGRPVPTASDAIAFTITGGTILGTGNGDPNSHEKDSAPQRRLFNGLAQVLVQAMPGSAMLRLSATAPGLAAGRTSLSVTPAVVAEVAPAEGRQPLTEWRVAPASATPPAIGQALAEGDMNSWAWVKPGATEPGDPAARYVLYRLAFTPRPAAAERGGQILFASLAGHARIWLDGRAVATKADPAPARLALPLPPGPRAHVLEILFDSGGGTGRFGLAGSVTLLPAVA